MKIRYSKSLHCTYYLGQNTDDVTDDDLGHHLKHFTKRLLVRKLIVANVKNTGTKKMALLLAHGYPTSEDYRYWDNGETVPVQDWIDENDGKFNVLIIVACNTNNRCVHSTKSIIIHANRHISLAKMMRVKGGFSRIYIPIIGYFEKNYYAVKKHLKIKSLG